MSERIPRLLDARELRVLGCLLEKQQTTPEYYPLTENALLSACNQRSSRDPVMNLTARDLRVALERLLQERLVAREEGSRATRWSHALDRRWGLTPATRAALGLLLLRGPQTTGEIRTRGARLYEFASAEAAESALAELAAPPEPLVELLEREPGQKEPRWGHRLAAPEAAGAAPPSPRSAPPDRRALDPEQVLLRIERLEQQVRELEAALRRLRGATD